MDYLTLAEIVVGAGLLAYKFMGMYTDRKLKELNFPEVGDATYHEIVEGLDRFKAMQNPEPDFAEDGSPLFI